MTRCVRVKSNDPGILGISKCALCVLDYDLKYLLYSSIMKI
jgi:hypothetical protein